jgi:hypothetical protein
MPSRSNRHDAAAAAFLDANPRVYDIIVRLARQAKRAGHTKCGMSMLFEVVRWEVFITTHDPSDPGFKINNNYRAWFARFVMACEPDLDGFFDVRE